MLNHIVDFDFEDFEASDERTLLSRLVRIGPQIRATEQLTKKVEEQVSEFEKDQDR